MSQPIVLVDSKNCAYRAAYASVRGDKPELHPMVYFLRHMAEIINKFKPAQLCCFYDSPRHLVWRRKLFELYKAREDNTYIAELSNSVRAIETACKALFQHMGVHEFYRETQETDDLIYSACRVLQPAETIVVSSDSDFEQVAFRIPSVKLYNPQEKSFQAVDSTVDPVVCKALAGDTSDRIDGYYGIGKVKGRALASSITKRHTFLESSGDRARYYRNLLLIDLAYNPKLIQNDIYVAGVLAQSPKFDPAALREAIHTHKLMGIESEWSNTVLPFKLTIGKPDVEDSQPDSEIEHQQVQSA